MRQTLVIVGNGMVGHRFIELMIERGAAARYDIVVFGEEPRLAYDRVHLSDYFAGSSADSLTLATAEQYQAWGVRFVIGQRVQAIQPQAQTIHTASGQTVRYDRLVLATGSTPFVPPIEGREAAGTFVYRTLDDLDAIRAYASGARVGAVIGGGLLGLECANALKMLGLETHVVEFAPRLMPMQVDEQGGKLLRAKIEALGVRVHVSKATTAIVADAHGRVNQLVFADGQTLQTDMVVFSAGIRPRDELARAAGLALGARGGIAIRPTAQTSDPHIYAIGECAAFDDKLYGLVAPGYQMAAAAADALMDAAHPACFEGADLSTKLKLMGVDVASFGDAFATTAGSREISFADAVTGTYKKIVIDKRGKSLLGGILVGDAADYGVLHQMVQARVALPPNPQDLILPARKGAPAAGLGIEMLPDSAKLCSCENLSKGEICSAIHAHGLTTVSDIKACTKAGTGCGGCVPMLNDVLKAELRRMGKAVTNHVCEHFAFSRQELFHKVKVQGWRTFGEVLQACGSGRGCEICKPVVASILASVWNEHILDKPHAPLQDSNDYFMANIQRDGTYSVVPRVPGGEITPDKLIVIGQVAKAFGLYVKITGGQRIDLFGARVDQLPAIWARLVEAGFESGHAYGKALRTVKSCVGTTWCRYGQQDSVGFAIAVENRYKGLRAPHKLKGAVSGCTRECAEAQSKDFGLIATEKGYNLYVCGNGGVKPQHAQLLAEDLTEEQAIRYLDRFLMFYIRTADRLQRTAPWLNALEGGIDYLKQVVIHDSLGLCEELERDMAQVVGTYQCEWRATLADEEKLKRFRHFVNSDASDPNIVMVEERGQKRPAYPSERSPMLPAGFVPLGSIE